MWNFSRGTMSHHQCPSREAYAACATQRQREADCASRYQHRGPRGAVPGCGHEVEQLNRLQKYRKANAELFITQDGTPAAEAMRVLSTKPKELLSRPSVPYVISSYQLDSSYRLRKTGGVQDPNSRSDRPPLVHSLPTCARYVRVSIPGRMGRPLPPDSASQSNSAMRARSKVTQDESLSIYASMRPGRSLPDHICKPRMLESLDIRREKGMPRSVAICDPEEFLYNPKYRVDSGLAGEAVPNFRSHYDVEATIAAKEHPRAGEFEEKTCTELEKLSHLRAGLQVLHCKLWRRKNNPPPSPPPASAEDTVETRLRAALRGVDTEDGDYWGWLANSPFPNL